MRFGILILVVLALAALAALLWWRFKGPGKPAAPVAVLATRNHHSLRTFHYETAAATQSAKQAAASAEVGEPLARLLPREDLAAPEPAHFAEEAKATLSADNAESTTELGEADLEAPAEDTPRPASIRHAAGALASLLEVQEEAVVPAAAPEPAVEADEEPAEALFHNPITAPAPTANDQANRAAEIALRQQRRARMSADAAAQRAALSSLFPGAGSPIPMAKPS
ncbi:hypothetical protein IC235_16280 [Hymenobacter sp. BT664]|uniref:Uncharacterized protein n=1 Tax=Hymenobacter montanus TaxID=2771359 RepID=A0A927GKD0_9BACT|nr:hypothetical protein [Hymenobacter montanus]MBD2769448.1 hypothetical protein [Hymenobacter montanus]